MDGQSFLPTLLGQEQPQPPFIYHEYNNPSDPSLIGLNLSRRLGQNIRMGNWQGLQQPVFPADSVSKQCLKLGSMFGTLVRKQYLKQCCLKTCGSFEIAFFKSKFYTITVVI